MSKIDEDNVSEMLTKMTGIIFSEGKYKLGNWGEVDKWSQIIDNTFIFLEVETIQKHPNTNILKVWPYLDENINVRVFHIQAFFSNSPGINSNRGRLAEWTANKIKLEIGKRYEYCKIILDESHIQENINSLLRSINNFISSD